ncbi:MAG: murein biosynthesis integral membrane protein MurJ [Planctomycetia bacterium]
MAGAAGRVSAATLVSRVTGLLRETGSAALCGLSPLSDAFVFAFRIPNLLREFFAEGALSSAFVPVFARVRKEQGDAEAFVLARRMLGTLAAVTGLLVLLGIAFAPVIVDVVASDAPDAQRPLTVALTRIMFPFLALAALAAVAMGVLNTHRRYFLPALAPAAFNVVAVLGGGVLLLLGWPAEQALLAWAGLVVLGGLAQVLVQVPALRSVGLRGAPSVDLAFRDPRLREVAGRMGPVVISLAGTNVMLLLTTAMASRGAGWATGLSFAFRLVHLPIGIVGVSIGTVVLAAGARSHAAGESGGLDDVVRRGLKLSWFLAAPAAVGLAVLAEPLVRMVYGHGRFAEGEGVALTADALAWYAGAVVAYAGTKASVALFLARGDTRTPALCSLVGIAANLAVAYGTLGAFGTQGYRALALAVVVGTVVNFVLLRVLGRVRFGSASAPGAGYVGRVLLASAAMGAVGWVVLLAQPRPGALLTLALCAGLGLLYFLLTALLGLPEAGEVARRLRLLRGRGPRQAAP